MMVLMLSGLAYVLAAVGPFFACQYAGAKALAKLSGAMFFARAPWIRRVEWIVNLLALVLFALVTLAVSDAAVLLVHSVLR